MNKGRNIVIAFVILLSVSLLTFLVNINKTNTSGVVDNVRYYQVASLDDAKDYEFYFLKGECATGNLFRGDKDYTITIDDHPYIYIVEGTSRKNATVEYEIIDPEVAKKTGPFDLYTEEFFKAMVFGGDPVLSVTEAIIIGVIALFGGIVIGKSEDIWELFNKNSEKEYPEWNESRPYRIAGISIIGVSVVLLVLFILI